MNEVVREIMKGYCKRCSQVIDETEYCQNAGYCQKCRKQLIEQILKQNQEIRYPQNFT
jgi:hypothetical protein